jgi:predicted nucleotidyltransferase
MKSQGNPINIDDYLNQTHVMRDPGVYRIAECVTYNVPKMRNHKPYFKTRVSKDINGERIDMESAFKVKRPSEYHVMMALAIQKKYEFEAVLNDPHADYILQVEIDAARERKQALDEALAIRIEQVTQAARRDVAYVLDKYGPPVGMHQPFFTFQWDH